MPEPEKYVFAVDGIGTTLHDIDTARQWAEAIRSACEWADHKQAHDNNLRSVVLMKDFVTPMFVLEVTYLNRFEETLLLVDGCWEVSNDA